MKLKRFNSENINEEMYFTSDRKQTDDEKKFEIIERLSNHWTEKLKSDYLVPRSLYNYSLDELIKIEDYYLNDASDLNESSVEKLPKIFTYTKYALPSDEDLQDIHRHNLTVEQIINGFGYTIIGRGIKNDENKKMIYDSIKMLYDKYPNDVYKEALAQFKTKYNINENNLIEESLKELQQLHSTNEAVENIRIEGNEIVFDCKCETDIQGTTEYNGIPLRFNKLCTINENVYFDDELSEKEIIAHARLIKEQCINEYLNEIKKKL